MAVYFGPSKNEATYTLGHMSLITVHPDMIMVHVDETENAEECAKKYGVSYPGSMLVKNFGDNKILPYTGKPEKEAI